MREFTVTSLSVSFRHRAANPLRIKPETLWDWVAQAEIDEAPRCHDPEAQRINELARGVRELRRANEILRMGWHFRRGGARPQDADDGALVDTAEEGVIDDAPDLSD